MRERWARWLALLTGVLLVAAAALLAAWHNRTTTDAVDARAAPSTSEPDSALHERGRIVYREQGCARCHAIAGAGNSRNPLDGIGAELDAAQLRQWITADAAVAQGLSTRVRVVKQGYGELPEADLEALIAYLQSLPPQ